MFSSCKVRIKFSERKLPSLTFYRVHYLSSFVSTQLKAPWTLINSKLQTDPKWLHFKHFCGPLRKKKKKEDFKGPIGGFQSFYFYLLFCYCHHNDWVLNSRIKIKSAIFTKFSLCKIAVSNTMRERLLHV